MTVGHDMGKLIEEYDRLAERFYKETGVVAPGKDIPAAMGPPDEMEVRQKFFDYWCKCSAALKQGGTE